MQVENKSEDAGMDLAPNAIFIFITPIPLVYIII
jgi:hypothetical protein